MINVSFYGSTFLWVIFVVVNFQFHLNYSHDFPHSPKKILIEKWIICFKQFKDMDVTYMILIKNYKITYLHSKGWG
jgi:hypothetical protein